MAGSPWYPSSVFLLTQPGMQPLDVPLSLYYVDETPTSQ